MAGGNKEGQYCVPFVSEYTDCTEDNKCDGCKKCKCSAEGQWSCTEVIDCPNEESEDEMLNFDDGDDIEISLDMLMEELKEKEKNDKINSGQLVPLPEKEKQVSEEMIMGHKGLNLMDKDYDIEEEIMALMTRPARSVDGIKSRNNKDNGTITFYHTKDELDEDTLKTQNISGVLKAKTIDPKPHISRRTGVLLNDSLQIEYTQPKIYNQFTHNKIDVTHEDKLDNLVHDKISHIIGNYSQVAKNKDLTNLVVGELVTGDEVIGDRHGPVISNVTFQPENTTFTAMALIAGTLLYKLWNMEKDGTGDFIDTEMLRHEKIMDLLEIFKEPLNIKQELFLKNALDQISSALDKNKQLENISLCDTVQEVQKAMVERKSQGDGDKIDTNKTLSRNDTVEAMTDVKNVEEIIDRYQKWQDSFKTLQSPPTNKNNDKVNSINSKPKSEILSTNEKSALNKFGKILETIAKGLLPNNKSKKLIENMNNANFFTDDDVVRQKLKQLYNIDVGNMSVSTKDRIVLDYLTHIQNKPKCLLENQKPLPPPTLESNILLNLSEFFKIKSISDLIKLVHDEDKVEEAITENVNEFAQTTERDLPKSMGRTNEKILNHKQLLNGNNTNETFENSKDKLKKHIQTIIEDITELQKSNGKVNGKDIKITDVLPCLYNILEVSKSNETKIQTKITSKQTSLTDKMKIVLDTIKKESKLASSRRMNTVTGPTPKSAQVWDRVLKNIKPKKNTRRNMSQVTKTIEEIKALMQKIESSSSNVYKSYAFLHEVPPAERLLLLKTFEADTQKYIYVLQELTTTLESKAKIPTEDYKQVSEFLDEALRNINLNEKVVKNLNKAKEPIQPVQTRATIVSNSNTSRLSKLRNIFANKTSKFTKDQIINQIIKNRVQRYIKIKETNGQTQDINYDIAKKILLHLDLGNHVLARELFKILAVEKQKESGNSNVNKNKEVETLKAWSPPSSTRFKKEPIIKFVEPKTLEPQKDDIIKQLLNIRNKF